MCALFSFSVASMSDMPNVSSGESDDMEDIDAILTDLHDTEVSPCFRLNSEYVSPQSWTLSNPEES